MFKHILDIYIYLKRYVTELRNIATGKSSRFFSVVSLYHLVVGLIILSVAIDFISSLIPLFDTIYGRTCEPHRLS